MKQWESKQYRIEKWNECIEELFVTGVPQYFEWTDLKRIARVLNHLGKKNENGRLHYTFLPNPNPYKFWLLSELKGAKLKPDSNEIELELGSDLIWVGPTRLTFHHSDPDIDSERTMASFEMRLVNNTFPEKIGEEITGEDGITYIRYLNGDIWINLQYSS